jgi:hypothetical protein
MMEEFFLKAPALTVSGMIAAAFAKRLHKWRLTIRELVPRAGARVNALRLSSFAEQGARAASSSG